MNQTEVNYRNETATSENANSENKEMKSSSGCCCSTRASINRRKEKKTMPNSQNETKQTTVTAPEIVCGGCASSIKKALGAISGVSEVDVDVATKKVTVKHGENVSQANIVDALDRAGYSVAS